MFEILFSPSAADFVENADKPLRKRLDRCFAQLRKDPTQHNNSKALKGEFAGLFRFRNGDWRIIYRIDRTAYKVVVIDVGHRRDIYE